MKIFENGITFYDEKLPRHQLKGKECIWWEQTVGTSMKCLYKGKVYTIEFLDYEKRFLTIRCSSQIKRIEINTFYGNGGIVKMLNSSPDICWKYKIGEKIKNKKGEDYEVVDKRIIEKQKNNYTSREKHYKYKCLKCSLVGDWHREDAMIGCPYCSGKKVSMGFNDMNTLFPQYVKYLKDPMWANTHTGRGVEIVDVVCPICGYEKQMFVNNLTSGHFCCDKCCDGFSYPEKFVANMLKQLKIEYVYQLAKNHFEWCDKYKYDFYLPQYNAVIEVHGKQHYEETSGMFTTSLYEQQKIDDCKKLLALSNGVKHYFVIDAKYSEHEYIKKSLCSTLDFLDFDSVNWIECERYAVSSLLVNVCEEFKNNDHTLIPYLAQKFNIGETTIRDYIKKGTKLGLCHYVPQIGGYNGTKNRTTTTEVV